MMSRRLSYFLAALLWVLVLVRGNSDNDDSDPDETRFYSYNGHGNNVDHPSWGAANTTRVRILPSFAANATSIVQREQFLELPSARRIMEELFREAPAKPDILSSHFLLEFGHLIAHDLVGMVPYNDSAEQPEPFPIPCDGTLTDILFCPVTGQSYNTSIDFWRAPHAIVGGDDSTTATTSRATLNARTSFLDLEVIYGTTPEEAAAARAFEGGILLLDDNGLPPVGSPMRQKTPSTGVFSLAVVFMRFHNLIAERMAPPQGTTILTDEEEERLFQRAREYTIAVYQSIVEQKYIPTTVGWQLYPYDGYNSSIHPGTDEFFAAVAFRYAHSGLSALVRILDEEWQPLPKDPLLLRDVAASHNINNIPQLVQKHGGIEPFLRGLSVHPAKAVDASIVDDLNIWTQAVSVLDIQRGRDVGIPRYNQVRQGMGLSPMTSMEELAQNDTIVLQALQSLYHNDIDQVDAYVGALLEPPLDVADFMGPLFTFSILDQFQRVQDGDRFWYKNRYTPAEYEAFPTITDVIRMTCSGMEDFPEDAFTTYAGPPAEGEEGSCGASTTKLSMLSGEFTLAWLVDIPTVSEKQRDPTLNDTIDVTLIAKQPMEDAGFLAVGWRSRYMNGAEMWVCVVNRDMFESPDTSSAAFCSSNNEGPAAPTSSSSASNPAMFSCCLSAGRAHEQSPCAEPVDEVYYELEVVDWCLMSDSTSVTVRAPVCQEPEEGQEQEPKEDDNGPLSCFRLNSAEDGTMDFIVAFNPNDFANHGYMRRTAAQVDLRAGILTQNEDDVVDQGLIATHGLFMLFGWMILAPISVFIVRYCKTKTWRLTAHISLMGVIGSTMIPLLIGVEASVGASDKTQEHSIVGLCLMGVWFVLAFAGRIRYLTLQGRRGRRTSAYVALIIHRYGGITMIACAWWNCYTGLVKIGPEDSYVQAVVFSSIPLGYNLPVFGFIRQYLFFPYLAVVCAIFAVAEVRRFRMNGSVHSQLIQGIVHGKTSVWDDFHTDHIEKMTMETYLELTRRGAALCIVDGCVLDITDFMEHHPGGRHLLRFARGSDITEELAGLRDVDGSRHTHSHAAIELMKTLVRAVLISSKNDKQDGSKVPFSASSRLLLSAGKTDFTTHAFRSARIVDLKYLTPKIEITSSCKPVILLRLALPKTFLDERTKKLLFLPGCVFTFRALDKMGATVERQYTPVKLMADEATFTDEEASSRLGGGNSQEHVLDFVISLVPTGKMSKILLGLRMGKVMLVQGPTINPTIVGTLQNPKWETIVMIAAGTGIATMLQLIDHYMFDTEDDEEDSVDLKKPARLFLMWVVKGAEYNYSKHIGLDRRVKRLRGRFKYTIVYSSQAASNQDQGPRAEGAPASRKNGDWNFHSILKKNWPITAPSAKQKVKSLVLGSRRRISSGGLDHSDTACAGYCRELTPDIWSGPPQYNSRHYDKDLIQELLQSVSPAAKREDLASDGAPTPSKGWVEFRDSGVWVPLAKAKELAAELDSTAEGDNITAQDPTPPEADGESGHSSDLGDSTGGVSVDTPDNNLLVAISGTSTFEYKTQVALRELAIPHDSILTFHDSLSYAL